MYEIVRNLFCPFEIIEKHVPKEGQILDVGCGHGILSRLMASNHNQRNILAIDPSKMKIKIARSKNKFKNIRYLNKYIYEIERKFDCITVIDVLYIFPTKEKIRFLKKVHSLLKKNGTFILKEINTKPHWMFLLSKIEEDLMIKIINYTHSDFTETHISSPRELRTLLKSSGFKIQTNDNFYGKLGYPSHILIVAKK